MNKRFRQYFGIFAAISAYYLIHEGAHFLTALYYGVFRQIHFMGLGLQIDVFAERMTPAQLGLFCLAGAAATLSAGWILVFLAKPICRAKSKVFKAAMWYVSLALLLLDPIYLSILCPFFGGGDMNGIARILPEVPVRIAFGVFGIAHSFVIWKYLLPRYTKSFQEERKHED